LFASISLMAFCRALVRLGINDLYNCTCAKTPNYLLYRIMIISKLHEKAAEWSAVTRFERGGCHAAGGKTTAAKPAGAVRE